tara:strand:- start:75 stop:239 length:165 start_codon:yes stop_codon:yes gene_type:complete
MVQLAKSITKVLRRVIFKAFNPFNPFKTNLFMVNPAAVKPVNDCQACQHLLWQD